MLNFQRNKLVSIVKEDNNTLVIHGVLEDHIFALELDVIIGIDDLKIRAIDGKWNRKETPECHRADPFLQEAVGIIIDDKNLSRNINKNIGRKSCPHYANLLIECCDAALSAVQAMQWEAAKKDRPGLTFEQFLHGELPDRVEKKADRPAASAAKERSEILRDAPAKSKEGGTGFIIDLHVHTFPASPCSSVSVEAVIQAAKRIGLDGICLTDHNHVWSSADVAELNQKHGFLVMRGNEITTDQGDVLVFGMEKDIRGIIKLTELKQLVDDAHGFMIVAHPFRGFLVFNTSQIGLTAEKAMAREAYGLVDAMEVLNGKVTAEENAFAKKVASGLGLPMTGGSDAHDIHDIGKYATSFSCVIRNEKDLLQALKSGEYEPCAYREFRAHR
jgi:predicted metal-dependent phosphoesterase TrpH